MNLTTVATRLCLSTLAVAVREFSIDCWRSTVETVEAYVVDHSAQCLQLSCSRNCLVSVIGLLFCCICRLDGVIFCRRIVSGWTFGFVGLALLLFSRGFLCRVWRALRIGST